MCQDRVLIFTEPSLLGCSVWLSGGWLALESPLDKVVT